MRIHPIGDGTGVRPNLKYFTIMNITDCLAKWQVRDQHAASSKRHLVARSV